MRVETAEGLAMEEELRGVATWASPRTGGAACDAGGAARATSSTLRAARSAVALGARVPPARGVASAAVGARAATGSRAGKAGRRAAPRPSNRQDARSTKGEEEPYMDSRRHPRRPRGSTGFIMRLRERPSLDALLMLV